MTETYHLKKGLDKDLDLDLATKKSLINGHSR